jgi:predicted deacylase
VRRLAQGFGCQWIVSSKGPRGSLRREATRHGVPTIILEAGEVWKVEPSVVSVAHRGICNVLADLGMIDGTPEVFGDPVVLKRTSWTRADHGGFLQFHTSPGHVVHKSQPLATCTSLLGAERSVITAPFHGVIIGMTTVPAVTPGEPVCHLGQIDRATMRRLAGSRPGEMDPMAKRLRSDLATNVHVVRHQGEES